MPIDIHESWKPYLKDEFNKLYFLDLMRFVDSEYKSHSCFPPENQIFNAFNHCHFEDVKVVIIGQDPYHGLRQAHGLCFSVNDGVRHPPSLINILKEVEFQLGVSYPKSGNLMHWANQGILLLNATLTVRAHEAGSHQKKGWEVFTDSVINTISNEKENVVFLLWGGYAKKKIKLIDTNKHRVLNSGHPSPLSANRGYWFGNNNFLEANRYLESKGLKPIKW
ncbi:MAG: uracil-DNA glycosylase [Algibacter sp.]|uniref:uracil-DNA glycosylase n=1 Tax=Algibacter sp. TaxID=1872428 RepID=UPI0026210AA8|nr:uracil-DNA glycosylase [Algibacter sp.]MDG1731042.1 uracil-DNA glycosylase [Algibacter sp.]MDG2178745.1 uracil-DNA glycosylase [Algibacter sp.]